MYSIRNYIIRINTFLGRAETGMLCVIVAMMVALAVLEIILRYVFKTSLLWKTVMLENLTLWLCFLGAALASCEKRHISIDVLNRILPKHLQRFRGYIIDGLSVIIIGFLIYFSCSYLSDEMKSDALLIGPIPLWFAKAIIPAGFSLMGLHLILHLFLNITGEEDVDNIPVGESD
ncbi:TRAP transporter small permease [Candidatus Poribacteria bacterium]|nr:TRAP transporter small permease [Candidatus Poribacteria bacterium]